MAFSCEVSKWTQTEVYEWAAENFGEDVASCFEGKVFGYVCNSPCIATEPLIQGAYR